MNQYKETRQKYYQAHREDILSKNKRRRENKIDEYRERDKRYYLRNRELRIEQARLYRQNNKDKIHNYLVSEDRKALARETSRKRRALVREKSDGTITPRSLEALRESQKFRCALCDCDIATKYHKDHIKPLNAGGLHTISNIQVLCPKCNLAKNKYEANLTQR